MNNPPPLTPGTVLHSMKTHYVIQHQLGAGGFGAVYLVTDRQGHQWALKQTFHTSQDAILQFEQEANVLSLLTHPHLPIVSDFFPDPSANAAYLVMEFIDGVDLSDLVNQRGALPEDQVLMWSDQVLSALEYLHTRPRPVIHRDIKPNNIRVADNLRRAVLVDFGIIKIGTGPTVSAARGVTPHYSPPEQYGSGGTRPASDIYALGCTLYHLLTGQMMPDSIDRAHSGHPLTPPRQLNPNISPHIEEVIMRATQLDINARFASAVEMRQAIAGQIPAFPSISSNVQPLSPGQAPGGYTGLPATAVKPDRPVTTRRGSAFGTVFAVLGGLVGIVAIIGVLVGGMFVLFNGQGGSDDQASTRIAEQVTAQGGTATSAPSSGDESSGVTPVATHTPLPEGMLLFDEFNDNSMRWVLQDNLFWIDAGALYINTEGAGGSRTTFTNFRLLQDYALTVRARSAGGQNQPYGVVTGVSQEADGYSYTAFLISNDGHFRAYRVFPQGGSYSTEMLVTAQTSAAIVPAPAYNNIRVEVSPATISYYVNNTLLEQISNPNPEPGWVGLTADDGVLAEFDSIEVRERN